MGVRSVQCNQCGAPLEVGEGTRYVTCRFCKTHLEVEQTATSLFTRELQEIKQTTAGLADDVRKLRLQGELDELERQWTSEQERYVRRDLRGRIRKPSAVDSQIGLVLGLVFAVIWTIGTAAVFPPMALFGIVFGAALFFGTRTQRQQADQLEKARRRYEDRRREILDSYGDAAVLRSDDLRPDDVRPQRRETEAASRQFLQSFSRPAEEPPQGWPCH